LLHHNDTQVDFTVTLSRHFVLYTQRVVVLTYIQRNLCSMPWISLRDFRYTKLCLCKLLLAFMYSTLPLVPPVFFSLSVSFLVNFVI